MGQIWRINRGPGPLVAAAIHDGHSLRTEVARLMALSEDERRREEDPYTGEWAVVGPTRVIGTRSRFEVDLNRSRERAVYRVPDDAWGLRVWEGDPPEDLVERSLGEYDSFYAAMHELLSEKAQRHGRFVVYDIHNYNHRREGPTAPPAAESENPQVNVGTGTVDRSRWGRVVDRFMSELRSFPFPGGALDVRENVKFRGGHFSRWIHEEFPDTGCALAIEFKKFFMDEWTGEADRALVDSIGDALRSTVDGVIEELERL